MADFKNQVTQVLQAYTDKHYGGVCEAAARGLGVPGSTLWRWLRGKCSPDLEVVSKAWAALGGGSILDAAPEAPEAPEAPAEAVNVLPLDGSPAAGEGALSISSRILDELGVRREAARWTAVPAGGAPAGTEPGDILVIDPDSPEPVDGGICALSLAEGIQLRRTTAAPSGWSLSGPAGAPSSYALSSAVLGASRGRAVLLIRRLA